MIAYLPLQEQNQPKAARHRRKRVKNDRQAIEKIAVTIIYGAPATILGLDSGAIGLIALGLGLKSEKLCLQGYGS
ncbi:MAG: hypothetical protein K1Y36_25415 [Blastocatellia bacterium]|nr:hypothetical protein [Blastocatellia bacterium]